MKLKDGSLKYVRVGYVRPVYLASGFCNPLQVTSFSMSPCKNIKGFTIPFYMALLIMSTCRLLQKD